MPIMTVTKTFICYRIALATEDGNVSEVTATKIEDLEDDTGVSCAIYTKTIFKPNK